MQDNNMVVANSNAQSPVGTAFAMAKSGSIRATVIRANGRIEELGIISSFDNRTAVEKMQDNFRAMVRKLKSFMRRG